MDKIYQPELLTDKSRLQEIYEFRVTAYENSSYNQIVNSTLFPNGWFDEVDDFSYHWYLCNEKNDIIATARLTYFENIEQLKSIGLDLQNFQLPIMRPFGFISRLVVDKSYRGKGVSKLFDELRIQKLRENRVEFAIAEVRQERISTLYKFGFKTIGEIVFLSNPKGQSEVLTLMLWENK